MRPATRQRMPGKPVPAMQRQASFFVCRYRRAQREGMSSHGMARPFRSPLNDSHFTEFRRDIPQNAHHRLQSKSSFPGTVTCLARMKTRSGRVRVSNSMRRTGKGRTQWRFIVGLSVLGLLIIASATHAGNRLPATGDVAQLEGSAGGGLTPPPRSILLGRSHAPGS